jgi:hypothetical protein
MRAALLALLALPVFAAVDGTVVNATTGKPQPNVSISLVQPGQGGMQTLGTTKTDAQGKFRIDKPAEGPQLVEATYDAVPYYKMISPGSGASGIQVDVYDATKDAQSAKISQHIVFIQPASDQLAVNEVYFVKNATRKTLNNTADGTLRFYVPGHNGAAEGVRVTISAPGGMPVERPAEATKNAGVFKVAYPVRPGETEFNIVYSLPAGTQFTSQSVQKGIDTRLVVPRGVTLEGDGVAALGADPSGKASLYSVSSQEYSVKIGGTAQAAPAGGQGAGSSQEEDTGAPQIRQTDPRVYGQLPVVLGLAAAILLLGFIVLYRSGGAKGKAGR